MMTLHAEASPDGDRDAGGPAQDSELAYQTHVMKVTCVLPFSCDEDPLISILDTTRP